MSNVIVAGVTQIETIVKVDSFYLDENERLFSAPIYVSAGGDAYDEALALSWLGDKVTFMSVVGRNQDMGVFNPADSGVRIDTQYMLKKMEETPTEVVFVDKNWKQKIFEDIKNLRDTAYDMNLVSGPMSEADIILLSNANFCRPFVQAAIDSGTKIALNLRTYNREKEKYNVDFLSNASILYLSDDGVDEDPFEFVKNMASKYGNDIVILGQGGTGLILFDKKQNINIHLNAVDTVKVVNTLGAGNALIASFVHYYLETGDSVMAIKNALLCASYKLGYEKTSEGFMTPEQVEHWKKLIWR